MDFTAWKLIPHTKFLSGQTFRWGPCRPEVCISFQIAIYKNKYISHNLSSLESNQYLATFAQVQPGLLIFFFFPKCHSVHDGTIFFNVSFYDKQLWTTIFCPTWGNYPLPGQVSNSASAWIKLCWCWLSFLATPTQYFHSSSNQHWTLKIVQQVRHLPNESTRHWRTFNRMIFTPTENTASMQAWGRNLSQAKMKKSTGISQKESSSLCSNCYLTKKEAENTQWYKCFKAKLIDHPNSSTMRSIFQFIIWQAFSFLVCFRQHHRFKSLEGM